MNRVELYYCNIEIDFSPMAKNDLKLFMVREIFEIYFLQMTNLGTDNKNF